MGNSHPTDYAASGRIHARSNVSRIAQINHASSEKDIMDIPRNFIGDQDFFYDRDFAGKQRIPQSASGLIRRIRLNHKGTQKTFHPFFGLVSTSRVPHSNFPPFFAVAKTHKSPSPKKQ